MEIRGKIGLAAGCVAAGVAAWAAWDYAKWRSLGPGGLPANLSGWAKMVRYRLIAQDQLNSRLIIAAVGAEGDLLAWNGVRDRDGARPKVSPYPIPHRQLSQLATPEVRMKLSELFERAVRRHGEDVHFALSHFEKRHMAITLRSATGRVGALSHGEIAHIHPSDNSMHMILSPTDAVAAMKAGWAQRHGLAGVAVGLPVTYVMIYSPRGEEDLMAIDELLDAAIAYAIQPA